MSLRALPDGIFLKLLVFIAFLKYFLPSFTFLLLLYHYNFIEAFWCCSQRHFGRRRLRVKSIEQSLVISKLLVPLSEWK